MRTLLALACSAALAGSVAAEPTSAAAAFSAGLVAYERGDYATAIAAFEAAFRVDPRAEVAFTLGQAHRNQYFIDRDITHLQRALGLYRHYLAEAPRGRRAAHARLHLETIETILAAIPSAPTPADEPQATQLLITSDAPGARAAVDGGAPAPVPRVVDVAPGRHRVRLEAPGHDPLEIDALALDERLVVVPGALRARAAELAVTTQPGAQITVDGRPVAATSQHPPGVHRVVVTARGRIPVVRDVELAAGAREALAIELVPTPRRRAARLVLYGAAGLGGTAVLGAGIAWLAQRDAVAILDRPVRSPADLERYRDAVDRRDTWRGVSIGLASAAAVSTVTGALLWYFDVPAAPEASTLVTPHLGPETVGASVVHRF